MKKKITEGALVAQMVRDAISNDTRVSGYTNDYLYERACLWYDFDLQL